LIAYTRRRISVSSFGERWSAWCASNQRWRPGRTAGNGRFRKAFAALLKDRSWPGPAGLFATTKQPFIALDGSYVLLSSDHRFRQL